MNSKDSKHYCLLVPVNRRLRSTPALSNDELNSDGYKSSKVVRQNSKVRPIDKSYQKLILNTNNINNVSGPPAKIRPNILSRKSSAKKPDTINNVVVAEQHHQPLSVGDNDDAVFLANSVTPRLISPPVSFSSDNGHFQLHDGRLVSFCGSLELDSGISAIGGGDNECVMKFDYQSLLKQFYAKTHNHLQRQPDYGNACSSGSFKVYDKNQRFGGNHGNDGNEFVGNHSNDATVYKCHSYFSPDDYTTRKKSLFQSSTDNVRGGHRRGREKFTYGRGGSSTAGTAESPFTVEDVCETVTILTSKNAPILPTHDSRSSSFSSTPFVSTEIFAQNEIVKPVVDTTAVVAMETDEGICLSMETNTFSTLVNLSEATAGADSFTLLKPPLDVCNPPSFVDSTEMPTNFSSPSDKDINSNILKILANFKAEQEKKLANPPCASSVVENFNKNEMSKLDSTIKTVLDSLSSGGVPPDPPPSTSVGKVLRKFDSTIKTVVNGLSSNVSSSFDEGSCKLDSTIKTVVDNLRMNISTPESAATLCSPSASIGQEDLCKLDSTIKTVVNSVSSKLDLNLLKSSKYDSTNTMSNYWKKKEFVKPAYSYAHSVKHRYHSGFKNSNHNNNWRLWLNEYMKPIVNKSIKKKSRKKIDKFTQTDPQITEFYACARHRPYDELRKERNWFYFYIHQCRTFLPKFGGAVGRLWSKEQNLNLNEKIRNERLKFSGRKLASSNLSKFQLLKQNPPKLTVKRSPIHKIGVYANESIAGGTFLIEYVGIVIRNALVERRELAYRQKVMGFGSYMFRLDNKHTIDATLKGCVARFINHSCEPNCIAKVVRFDNKKHIVLIASKNIKKDEEICYDYKMPKEDEKMPCLCNSTSCRKYIN